MSIFSIQKQYLDEFVQKIKAISVLIAALGINLIIGVLYAWSIFKEAIVASIQSNLPEGFHWSLTQVNDPYALCCLVFAFSMIPAGRVQDVFGPRVSSGIGAFLGGLGFYVISTSTDYWVWMIGFGGLVGAGIGFAYASTTPAALKWFAQSKSTLVTGVVVSGFALASIYIAPLATHWLLRFGLLEAMQLFALQFFIMVAIFSCFLLTPPKHYIPMGEHEQRLLENSQLRHVFDRMQTDITKPIQVLKNPQFWLLWGLLFIGAGAGLMVIGNIKPMAKQSMGELAYVAIVILAVGDAAGRMMSGVFSTRFGRKRVLIAAFALQTILMLLAYEASQSATPVYIMLVATLIGINYGVNLVLFPSYVKDFWGMKHFGYIYGMLFTAWGVGGFTLVQLSEYLTHLSGNAHASFMVAGGLVFSGLLLAFGIDNTKEALRLAQRKQAQVPFEIQSAAIQNGY